MDFASFRLSVTLKGNGDEVQPLKAAVTSIVKHSKTTASSLKTMYDYNTLLLQSNFKMDTHVLSILSQCTQRMYLLKLLKQQGMSQQQLSVIAQSIIVSRILYALPAWGGFLSVELKKTKSMLCFKCLKMIWICRLCYHH